MSHSSSIFNRVPIDLPNKSGFNLDHENCFTATCGTLTPCLIHPLLPNDTISLGVNFQVQLPPMVTDFYGKVDACIEAFFVPYRLLYGGWEDFITHPTKNPRYPEGTLIAARPSRLPVIRFQGDSGIVALDTPGSLSDMLGAKVHDILTSSVQEYSALPWLAYHMIYHHWYRDSRIQAPCFYPSATGSYSSSVANAPYVSVVGLNDSKAPTYNAVSVLGDGVRLCDLRQRNWSKGYFTTASPYPQAGGDSEIQFTTAGDSGAISIAAIRSANSLQKWMERNNFSYEYGDQIYAQYGIYPDAAKMNKPIYLGRVRETVYSRSVMQTAGGSGDLNNVVGAKKASSQSIGEGRLIEKFTASEHGYLMCIFSLVPHGYYSTGVNRFLFELESEDVPFPLLAGMGDQPIYKAELSGNIVGTTLEESGIFGYTDLYAHYKYMEDEVHGLLRDGYNLQAYQLQRSFDENGVDLGSEFLEIPINALDQVQAVATSTSGFSCWNDVFFKFSKISTLPAYSLPTLGDLKNTHTGYVSRGGSRL